MTIFSAESLASLPPQVQQQVIRSLTPEDAARLAYEWRFWARANQIAPEGAWRFWLLLAGRGFGKTRAAGEWIRERVDAGSRHFILAGPTASDVRDIMIEGESGILAISPPWNRPKYEPSKARLTWPSGARAILLSADEPDRFRGKQCDTFWAEELASWRYPEAWDQMMLGFRLGAAYGVKPRGIVSTTPRPLAHIKDLAKHKRCVISSGSTYENIANLAPEFVDEVRSKYEGTRLGLQELHAKILDDVADALWTYESIAVARVEDATPDKLPAAMSRIVIAVDPSGCSGPEDKRSDEIGISVVGLALDGGVYVLEDASGRMGPAGPEGWGARVAMLFYKWKADAVIGEVNFGGAMVQATILAADEDIPFRDVNASRAKHVRAGPVAVLFQKGKAFLCGVFKELEEQLVQFSTAGYMGRKSPDRADAMVWGVYALGVVKMPGRGAYALIEAQAKALGLPATSVVIDEVVPVLMRAPPQFSMPCQYQCRTGRNYYVVDGHIEADPGDVEVLLSAGFAAVPST